MIVYNLFKGTEIKMYKHIYSSYISDSHKIKANFSITIDYTPGPFKDFIDNYKLRDIIIYENCVYYYYAKCTLVNMIINSSEQKITLGINGDCHYFISDLPDWIYSDIRIAKIENIIKDDTNG